MADDLSQEGDEGAPAPARRGRPRMHVQMKRDREIYAAPHSATVHVDEVDNWAKHGWERVEG